MIAGVRTCEILIAHTVTGMMVMAVMMLNVVIALMTLKFTSSGSFCLLAAFLVLAGWSGIFYGLCGSALFSSHVTIQTFILFGSQFAFFLSGNLKF